MQSPTLRLKVRLEALGIPGLIEELGGEADSELRGELRDAPPWASGFRWDFGLG